MAHHHTRWESRLIQPTGDLPLARMLVPFTVSQPGLASQAVDVEELATDRSVVLGVAGSGKSTFAKWLATETLEQGLALPMLIRIRDLDPKALNGSVDQALETYLLRQIPQASAGFLDPLLRDPQAPPVLLILDGWDELGGRAPAFRQQLLGLLTSYPRLGLVLTARPGALALPGADEDTQLLHLDLLDEKGVAQLSNKILTVLSPEAPATQSFLDNLAEHPKAMALARRPLLLQMLLMHHPDPLPRSTARLYQACIEGLLAERDPEQIRLPELTALAYRLQELQAQEVRNSHLPPGWSLRKRRSFLDWAQRDSGLLEQRQGSGELVFIYSSVREYLAATHLHLLDQAPVPRIADLAEQASWAPVLRMWIGLLKPPQRLALLTQLQDRAKTAHWALWLRLHALCLDTELGELARPSKQSPTGAFLAAINGACSSSACVATGRVLSAGSPLWPGSPWELVLLGAWPNRRVGISRRLQQLALLGATTEQLTVAAQAPLRSADSELWKGILDQVWGGFLDDHGTYMAAESWAWASAMGDPERLPAFLPHDGWEVLARTETPAHLGGSVALLRAACRARLGLDNALEELLTLPQADPLWRSLALTLCGRQSSADVALLTDLAQDPSQRQAPLSWGLQWIVRGDLLLLNGQTLPLEALNLDLPLVELL
ncbi:MAG: hypothetical protein ACI9VR_000358 [Cognaticolwellia sp.]|jgi:hypothetical protein